jgi:isocitrate dehydrogenase
LGDVVLLGLVLKVEGLPDERVGVVREDLCDFTEGVVVLHVNVHLLLHPEKINIIPIFRESQSDLHAQINNQHQVEKDSLTNLVSNEESAMQKPIIGLIASDSYNTNSLSFLFPNSIAYFLLNCC